jgi:hypothetical protein
VRRHVSDHLSLLLAHESIDIVFALHGSVFLLIAGKLVSLDA